VPQQLQIRTKVKRWSCVDYQSSTERKSKLLLIFGKKNAKGQAVML